MMFRKLKMKGWAKMYQAAKEAVYNVIIHKGDVMVIYGPKIRTPNFMK